MTAVADSMAENQLNLSCGSICFWCVKLGRWLFQRIKALFANLLCIPALTHTCNFYLCTSCLGKQKDIHQHTCAHIFVNICITDCIWSDCFGCSTNVGTNWPSLCQFENKYPHVCLVPVVPFSETSFPQVVHEGLWPRSLTSSAPWKRIQNTNAESNSLGAPQLWPRH